MQFTKQETATVLAALRYWQSTFPGPRDTIVPPAKVKDHFNDERPLRGKEIDSLCERINFDEPLLDIIERLDGAGLVITDTDAIRAELVTMGITQEA